MLPRRNFVRRVSTRQTGLFPRRQRPGNTRRSQARVLARAPGSLQMDTSHRHSVGRGAAYYHMLANPWADRPVRPPHALPIPTSLVKSITRTTMTPDDGEAIVGALIRIHPGVGATTSGTVDNSNNKVVYQYFDSAAMFGTQQRVRDRVANFMYANGDTYRPIAMGVRITNTTQADLVGGHVLCRLDHKADTTSAPNLAYANVEDVENDTSVTIRSWDSSRRLQFAWHPMNQSNSEFMVVSDSGPDYGASGANPVLHNRSPNIELVVRFEAGSAPTLILETCTWYEFVPKEEVRDFFPTRISVLSPADVTSAAASVTNYVGSSPAIDRSERTSSGLTAAGVGIAAANAAVDALENGADTVVGVARGAVRRFGEALDTPRPGFRRRYG